MDQHSSHPITAGREQARAGTPKLLQPFRLRMASSQVQSMQLALAKQRVFKGAIVTYSFQVATRSSHMLSKPHSQQTDILQAVMLLSSLQPQAMAEQPETRSYACITHELPATSHHQAERMLIGNHSLCQH